MRVNWRTLLAVLGGLLLPIPLVWAIMSGQFQRPTGPATGDRRISPVLTYEQRSNLQTYRRECLRKEDCEPPLGCLLDTRAGWFYCTDSECATDAQCPEGFTCQPHPTRDGPLVRTCIPPGIRKQGENCISIPVGPQQACEPGLLCAEGWCGRPCQREDPESCPEGFFCGDTIPGPACLPTCEARPCPSGLRCVRDERVGASSCATVHGEDCQRNPCPNGGKCMAVFGSSKAGQVWMECYPQCDKDLPSCPEGFLCEGRVCRKACDPSGPEVCEPGFKCLRRIDQQPWACQPDM